MSETEVIPTGEVHPVAELFPMLPDDELQELADDIRANGLHHPIVLDKDGVLIDGRNRWAACQMAGIDPKFTNINGDDPVAYILSANVSRRHMTKGQRAMAVAMARFATNQTTREVAVVSGVSQSRIVYADVVREYAPDLTKQVLSAALSLDDAYAEAQRRKKAETTDEARFKKLQESAPDLATLVSEERLTLGEAWSTYERREREAIERRKEVTRGYLDGIGKLWSYLATNEDIIVANWEPSANSVKHAAPLKHLTTSQGVRIVVDRLERLAQEIDKHGGELA